MKAHDLREMSDEQLSLTLSETAKNLFHLRIQSQSEKSAAPSELLKARRQIARIQTIQNERRRKTEAAANKAAQTVTAGGAK